MKIIVLHDFASGVEYHRLMKPLTRMQIDYPELDINVCGNISKDGVPPLKDYELVLFNRYLGQYNDQIIEYLCKHNIPYVIDIDDYWKLPKYHPINKWYKDNEVEKSIVNNIRYANGVTCSVEELARLIRPINHKVKIVQNALDFTDEQWNWPKVKNEKFTFGYVAGMAHANDAQLIGEAIQVVMDKYDCDFIYAGYSKNLHSNSIYTRLNNHQEKGRIKVMKGLSPAEYGQIFTFMDALVAPLENTPYNRCKSDIKIQEASAYNLPIIASDVLPYQNSGAIITNDWVRSMSEVIEGKTCQIERRDIEIENAKRIEFYKWILNLSIKDPT